MMGKYVQFFRDREMKKYFDDCFKIDFLERYSHFTEDEYDILEVLIYLNKGRV